MHPAHRLRERYECGHPCLFYGPWCPCLHSQLIIGTTRRASEVGARVPRYSWGTPNSPIVRACTHLSSVSALPPAQPALESKPSDDGKRKASSASIGSKDRLSSQTGQRQGDDDDDAAVEEECKKVCEDDRASDDGESESTDGRKSDSDSDDQNGSDNSSDSGGSAASTGDESGSASVDGSGSDDDNNGENRSGYKNDGRGHGEEEENIPQGREADERGRRQGSDAEGNNAIDEDSDDRSQKITERGPDKHQRQRCSANDLPGHRNLPYQLSSSSSQKADLATPTPYIMNAPAPQLTGPQPDTPVINRRASVLWNLARQKAAKDLAEAETRHNEDSEAYRATQIETYSELKVFRGRLLGMPKWGWWPDGPQDGTLLTRRHMEVVTRTGRRIPSEFFGTVQGLRAM